VSGAPEQQQPPRQRDKGKPVRWPLRLFGALLLLALAFSLTLLWGYRFRNGEYMAKLVMELANPALRGRLEFGSIRWGADTLIHLAVGMPAPARVEHFSVYDPQGERVIFAPRATAAIDLTSLISGGHVVLYNIEASGGYVNVTALPTGKGDETVVGFIKAFSSVTPSDGPGSRVELNSVALKNFRLKLAFPSWSVDLAGVDVDGTLDIPPDGDATVLYKARASARSGALTIAGKRVPVEELKATRFEVTSDDPQSWWFAATLKAAGAPMQAKGRMTDTFTEEPGVEMAASSKDAASLLRHLAGDDLGIGGDVQVVARLDGLLQGPVISGKVRGVTAAPGGVKLDGLQGDLSVDLGKGTLTAAAVQGRGLGGSFTGEGRMDMNTSDWSGALKVTGVDTGKLTPALAGRLDGRLKLKGVTSPAPRALSVVDLTLARKDRDWLPRKVKAAGTVHLGTRVLDLAGLKLSGDGHTLEARGSVNVRTGQVNLFCDVASPRLGRWLARKKIVQVVRGATTRLHVTGRAPALRARGTLRATGVGYDPVRLKRMTADVRFDGQDLKLTRIRSEGYGGTFKGEAIVRLFRGNVLHPLPMPLVRGKVRAVELDLAALNLGFDAKGMLSAEVDISGPLNRLTGTADLKLPRLRYLGEVYDGAWARLGVLQDRLSIYRSSFGRGGGGQLQGWGDLYYDGRLDLRLKATEFPITGVPQLADLPLGLGGTIRGQVNVNGTLNDPRLNGTVRLDDARLRGMAMGSGSVTLTSGSDLVRIKGTLLAGLLRLEGYLLTDPRARLHLRLEIDRMPLEKVAYEVRELGDVRGVISGTIRLDADSKDGLTWADARLPRVELSLRHRNPGERDVTVVRLLNSEDILARWDGSQLHVVTAKLETRVKGQKGKQANFSVGGWVSPAGADMKLRGKVAIEILEFFLAGKVQKLTGDAVANVTLKGPLNDLNPTGTLDLRRITIAMPRFQRLIEVPQGQIKLAGGGLQVDKFKVRVGRQELAASGTVSLTQFRPTSTDLLLTGDVNMELLQLLFPEHVSHSVGATWIKVRARGPVSDPQFTGQLKVKRVEVSPRGWGRTITLDRGDVRFSNYLIKTAAPLGGTYDEGLVQADGEVRLDRFDMVDIYLRITGTGIPQRSPNVYSAEFNCDVRLMGDSQRLALEGDLELVDLSYTRKFDVLKQAFIKPRVQEEDPPFWKGQPLLEDLALDLKVRTMGQILVKNNLANLSLSGDFVVVGTLENPRLGGLIRAEEGTFKLPYLRGDFSISQGQILFTSSKPMEQGQIAITSETTFEGRNQVDYLITLKVEGPLSNPAIQLSSVPNLDPGQISALLVTGRTTDELRKELGGGSETGASTGGGAQAAGAADAQVKQLTGEILSSIIEDPLKKVTRLDVISLEVGTESAQIRAGKKIGRYLNLAGEYELGLLGDSRAEGRLEVKMHDLLMLVGKWQRLSTRLETEDEDPNQGRLELKLSLPLR